MPDVNGTRHHLLLGWPDWAQSYPETGEPPDWEYDRDRDVERALKLGASAVLIKPFTREDLLATVTRVRQEGAG